MEEKNLKWNVKKKVHRVFDCLEKNGKRKRKRKTMGEEKSRKKIVI